MCSSKKAVWLIDDNSVEVATYLQYLMRGSKLDVRPAKLQPKLADYRSLAADAETGAVVLDQRLSDQSGVAYTGMEVATQLRAISPGLPIYILTNYADELFGEGQPAGFIVRKDELSASPEVWIERILRSVEVYEKRLQDRELRLSELVKMRLAGKLTGDEESELARLRAEVELPFGQNAEREERDWQERMDAQRKQLEELKEIITRLSTAKRGRGGDDGGGGVRCPK